MSHHVSKLLIEHIIKQKESFLLKKNLLTFRTTWAKSLLSLAGSPIRGRVKDAKEEPWPTMRMTPDAPEKANKSSKGAAALSGYPSADRYDAFLGLFIFADLYDNVGGYCADQKVWCVVGMPVSERKYLLGKEKKKLSRKLYCLMLSYMSM